KKAKKRRPWQKHWPVSEDSRSEAIRRLLEKNPAMKTADIQAELGEPVSANLIKVVRHNFKKKLAAQQRTKVSEDELRRMGLEDMPVGGVRRKSDAEIDAEVDDILNQLDGG